MNDNGFSLDGFVQMATSKPIHSDVPSVRLIAYRNHAIAILNKALWRALGEPDRVRPMQDPDTGTVALVAREDGYRVNRGNMAGLAISRALAPNLAPGESIRFAVTLHEHDGQPVAVIGERIG